MNPSNITHYLKCDPKPFEDICLGYKKAEIRRDDREPPFAPGMNVVLQETEGTAAEYAAAGELAVLTGRATTRTISHVQRGYGIPEGYVILSYHGAHYASIKVSRTRTYTCAIMEVPQNVYDLVKGKLEDAQYDHAIHSDGMLDMTHIGLMPYADSELRDQVNVALAERRGAYESAIRLLQETTHKAPDADWAKRRDNVLHKIGT